MKPNARIAAAWVAAAVVLLAGCAPAPPPAPDPLEKIKLSDLHPRVRSNLQPPAEDEGLTIDPGTLPARAVVTRLEIPREISLAPVWRLTSDGSFDPAVLELWHRNGLRIGVMDVSRAPNLIAALPDALDTHTQLRLRAPYACAVWMTPPIPKPRRVELTLGPDSTDHFVKEFNAGRFQFLVRLEDAPNDRVTVELRPHVFIPRNSIEVRTPMEKDLDGIIYDELTLSFDLAANQLLVIGPDSGWRSAPSPAATQPATQPSKPPARRKVPPPPPPRLGDMILTGYRFSEPIHAILVIGVHHSNSIKAAGAVP